ncbi:MAG TPA: hypothetical protein PK988_12845, partial [Candidatus Sumerlaeota bacterium]|nr:hypothetical protein [Candidatus Sumerlaeota bacterium]
MTEEARMFRNNDIIYVPQGHPLVFFDVHRWRRFEFDVEKFGLRVRSAAFEQIAGRLRAALEVSRHGREFAQAHPNAPAQTDAMIHDLSLITGALHGEMPASLRHFLLSDGGSWWVKLTDKAAESFHEDDYERTMKPVAGERVPYLTFGSVEIERFDNLEIALSEDEDGELPFAVDVPASGGLSRHVADPLVPLPIIREFCGVHGASAFGNTVNVTTLAEASPTHQFCTPLGRIGEHLFATLYIHYAVNIEAPVMSRIPDQSIEHYMSLLGKSGFEVKHGGNNHRILARGGDVVHLYVGLDGKESEGVEVMPASILVACAAGEFDPMQRAELLEAIKET